MIILGLNAFHGDSAAALVRDGKLIAAAEEERFRRVKHWAGFPSQAIAYCLREAGVALSDVQHVAVNQDSRANLFRKIAYLVAQRPNLGLMLNRFKNRRARKGIPDLLAQAFRASVLSARCIRLNIIWRISRRPFTFRLSRRRSSSRSTASAISPAPPGGLARAGASPSMAACIFPHSLGIFYQALTQYLGFPHYGDEYKVMGLAPYGKPTFMDAMRKIVRLKPDGGYELDLAYFRHHNETDLLSMGRRLARIWRPILACARRRCSGRAASPTIRSKIGIATSPARCRRCTKRLSFI